MVKLRRIRRYGNSNVIVLTPTDVKDNDLQDGGLADIDDIIFLNKNQLDSEDLRDCIAKQSNEERAKETIRRIKNAY